MKLVLSAVPEAARRARRHIAEVLADERAELVATAELIVTEMVTNAVLHGAGPIVVRAFPTAAGARVEVTDQGPHFPLEAQPTLLATTGRGLQLLAAFATGWGVHPAAGGGKTVWVDVVAVPDLGELTSPRMLGAAGGQRT